MFVLPSLRPLHQLMAQPKTIQLWLGLLCWACASGAWAQNVIHQGPSLTVQVQRGDTVLPLPLVNRLRSGDRLQVQADVETLAKGDWVLLLARVSPTGNQVALQHFNVRELQGPAELEITADNQAPVIVLAPQLRNLFGLYTSLSESADLLGEVLRADPQRFYELQKVDQINQAIQTLSESLARSVSGRSPQEAIAAAQGLAVKFGVRQLDPDCFKGQTVNTECVATHIVASKDFALPSGNDLSTIVGNKKAVDFNSFLLANLRIFSEASDYLSNKYRDSYDFAPTFGRRQGASARVDLYSIARFRNGSVKTAYIYVPAWFTGPVPGLLPDTRASTCFSRGWLDVRVLGRLPLANHWHGWRAQLRDPTSGQALGEIEEVGFDQERGRFSFAVPEAAALASGPQIELTLSGQFGFDRVLLEPLRLALPWPDAEAARQGLDGVSGLVSGERTSLVPRAGAPAPCLDDLALLRADGQALARNDKAQPRLEVDLRDEPPAPLTLRVQQVGAAPIALPVRVLPARAQVSRIEHAEGDDRLSVQGPRLARIARIELAGLGPCLPADAADGPAPTRRSFVCAGEVRRNAALPATVRVVHEADEPAPLEVRLTPTAAIPRLALAGNTPNALLVSPSAKALQWQLAPQDRLMTEDSGLSLLLQAQSPYTLAKGSYQLQLRFVDDPHTDAQPLQAPLIADFAHNELRTRAPIRFDPARLPSVVNPLEYRVLHLASGQASAWQALERAVLWLPDLHGARCAPTGDALWLQGQRLDLIDGVRALPAPGAAPDDWAAPELVPCTQGLCLRLPPRLPQQQVQLRMRWVDERVFTVRLPDAQPACP